MQKLEIKKRQCLAMYARIERKHQCIATYAKIEEKRLKHFNSSLATNAKIIEKKKLCPATNAKIKEETLMSSN